MSSNIIYTTNTPYYGNITLNPPASYSIGVSGTGGTGQVFTSTGSNGSWNTLASDNAARLDQSGTLELKGKNADLKINGVSLNETLENIQEMLGIMRMDPALEKEFEELKAAGKHYRQLREKFRDQKEVWDTLKDQDL